MSPGMWEIFHGTFAHISFYANAVAFGHNPVDQQSLTKRDKSLYNPFTRP
jgi:hypothetical protein